MNAVDTNILIYSCDQTEPRKHVIARNIISQTTGGVLVWQVAVEFISNARKLEAFGFTRERAWDRLRELMRIYQLRIPRPPVLDAARRLHLEGQWSFWDALIVAACLEAGVTRLYSEDLPGGRPPEGLEIINPFA